MANTTQNQAPLIKAQVYSDYIIDQIYDGFLPDGLHRDVTDFGDGETLYIPVMGDVVIRDYTEDAPINFDPIDTGQVTLTITEYVQGGTYITKKLRQDSYAIQALEAAIPDKFIRKIKEKYETDLLAQVNVAQTAANPNTINGADHRWVAGFDTTGVIDLQDFVYMKFAFDRANVPDEGRIAIVDPAVEAAINSQVALQGFTNNPMFEGMVTTGFANGRRFVRNIFGFDIWVSNRLPRVASETINGGPQSASTAISNGVVNVFMSIADDTYKPFMGAWRQMPQVDGEYVMRRQRDEYAVTARWGFGVQRVETVGAIITGVDYVAPTV